MMRGAQERSRTPEESSGGENYNFVPTDIRKKY